MNRQQAARNRRLAYLLVFAICTMIGITFLWMLQYHSMIGA